MWQIGITSQCRLLMPKKLINPSGFKLIKPGIPVFLKKFQQSCTNLHAYKKRMNQRKLKQKEKNHTHKNFTSLCCDSVLIFQSSLQQRQHTANWKSSVGSPPLTDGEECHIAHSHQKPHQPGWTICWLNRPINLQIGNTEVVFLCTMVWGWYFFCLG